MKHLFGFIRVGRPFSFPRSFVGSAPSSEKYCAFDKYPEKTPEAAHSELTGLNSWERALFTAESAPLLRLNGYHFASLPKFAAAFADLRRELRFSDLADDAKAAFVREILATLQTTGSAAARVQCVAATDQLRTEYARRRTR